MRRLADSVSAFTWPVVSCYRLYLAPVAERHRLQKAVRFWKSGRT